MNNDFTKLMIIDKNKILNQGDEYASEHWSGCDSPNEHDNAREDFIAGALWVVKNCSIPLVIGSVFDDKIDEWHNSNTSLSLHEYIGLTEDQFKIWLRTPEEIEKNYR